MRLTETIDFDAAEFKKLNKGFTNIKKINCFMNACL